MAPSFVCPICDKSCSRRFNLTRHMSLVHSSTCDIPPKHKSSFLCTICSRSCSTFSEFEEHISKEHDIVLKSETFNFKSTQDFDCWKNTIEENEKGRFSRNTATKKMIDNSSVAYYVCNRSGFFHSKQDRKRQLKVQGSCKINGFCPSRIRAKFKNDGSVDVVHCSTHVGHKPELAHKPLSLNDRLNIATQLANKVPFTEVLNNARSSFDENLKRMQLLTRHDLYNIETEFGLNCDSVRHTNDAKSVKAWVESQKQSESNCVIVYKPQGEEHISLDKDDFCLGIMTEAQQEIFKKFGNDCICIDRMNANGFQLITLMVIDDMQQGLPCAFYISNRTDKHSIELFLMAVKTKIGLIKPSVFMSDMVDSCYDAWCSVMEPVEKRMYCTWYVDKAWQTNLSKIKESGVRKEIYKKLRIILEETDETRFLLMLNSFVSDLCYNEITKDYGEYFKTRYATCYKSWAYCFRQKTEINANMHLESMHNVVKHLFLKGKTAKRLDEAIHAIMQMLRKKLFDRVLTLEKGKVTTKLKEIRNRHKKSLEMNSDLIISTNETKWEVRSSTSKDMQSVSLVETNCDCHLRCTDCDACVHMYKCTCIDSCIKWNFCKHIHLVCMMLKDKNKNQDDTSNTDAEVLVEPLKENLHKDDINSMDAEVLVESIEENLHQDDTNSMDAEVLVEPLEENLQIDEELPIFKNVRDKDVSQNSLVSQKLILKEKCDRILEAITTMEGNHVAEQALDDLEAKLKVVNQKYKGPLVIDTKSSIKKKVQLPKRLISTKNKEKKVVRRNKWATSNEVKQIVLTVVHEEVIPSTSSLE